MIEEEVTVSTEVNKTEMTDDRNIIGDDTDTNAEVIAVNKVVIETEVENEIRHEIDGEVEVEVDVAVASSEGTSVEIDGINIPPTSDEQQVTIKDHSQVQVQVPERIAEPIISGSTSMAFPSIMHKDAFLIFRALCKLSMKGLHESDESGSLSDPIALQNKYVLHYSSFFQFLYVEITLLNISFLLSG